MMDKKAKKMTITSLKSCEVDIESMVDEIIVQNIAPVTYDCDLCDRTFINGKALGGHKRSHFQAAKKHMKKVRTHFSNDSKIVNHKANNDDDDTWRGVTHNSDYVSENEAYYVGNAVAPNETQAIDLSNSFLPSWRKTDKMGRASIGDYATSENLVYFSDESKVSPTGAVVKAKSSEVPISFKKRKNIGESSTNEKHVVKTMRYYLSSLEFENNENEEKNTENGSSESGVAKILMNDWANEEFYGKDLNEISDNNNNEVISGGLQDHVGHFDEGKVKKSLKKWKKSKKVLSKVKTKDSEKMGGYQCWDCGKSYSTFQGLGGHRSIHKGKNIMTTIDESKHSDASLAEVYNSCSSCHLPKMDETTFSEETLADEASKSTCQKGLDFDLNEPTFREGLDFDLNEPTFREVLNFDLNEPTFQACDMED